MGLASHFIDNKLNTKTKDDCMIICGNYRFSVLSERLIRIECNEMGVFENKATELVVFRNFEKPLFNVGENENYIEIKTSYFTLVLNKKKDNIKDALIIKLNNSDKNWFYNHPEVRNFGGINVSLDNHSGSLKLDKGLYSTDGFVTIDDSSSMIINEEDQFVSRNGKIVDLYVFLYRKDFGLCLKDYYTLTGMPLLIPRYALGVWWYKNHEYNMDSIKSLVGEFRNYDIPLSIILFGDKWHDNINNYRFNSKLFNGEELIKYLNSENIKLGLTVNPSLGVNKDDSNYEMVSRYIKHSGDNIQFMPFDNTSLVLYLKLFINELEKIGVDFFNIDYYDPKDLHNLWLLNHYHYASSDRLENKRGLMLSRNCKITPHRYPITYTGKTLVTWETLNKLPMYNASASNIGVSFVGSAIGGYHYGREDEELYLRYIQFGTYSPLFILASEDGKYYKREPWRWDMGKLSIISSYMRMRQRLIPYIYSEGYVYHKLGAPLIQPLYYQYPEIYDMPVYKNEYLFGTQLLVAPITKKKDELIPRVIQRLFIPKGMWYEFKTGKKFPGGNYYVSFYKDEDYPVFCKAGGIVVLNEDYNSTEVPTNLEIHIFPGMSNSYKLYEDDGITNLYKEGYYLLTSIDYNYRLNNYTVIIRPLEGKTGIVPEFRNYKIRFRNTKSAEDVIIYMGDKQIECNSYVDGNDFILEIENVSTLGQLTINCKGKDIEIDAVRLINEEIMGILNDVKIDTVLKEKIDEILFSDLSIKKKRIEIRKLKRKGLETKFIKMFIKLLEYISEI